MSGESVYGCWVPGCMGFDVFCLVRLFIMYWTTACAIVFDIVDESICNSTCNGGVNGWFCLLLMAVTLALTRVDRGGIGCPLLRHPVTLLDLLRAINGSLAETPEFVVDFLELLAEKVRPRAQEDFEEMAAAKKVQQGNARVRIRLWFSKRMFLIQYNNVLSILKFFPFLLWSSSQN